MSDNFKRHCVHCGGIAKVENWKPHWVVPKEWNALVKYAVSVHGHTCFVCANEIVLDKFVGNATFVGANGIGRVPFGYPRYGDPSPWLEVAVRALEDAPADVETAA